MSKGLISHEPLLLGLGALVAGMALVGIGNARSAAPVQAEVALPAIPEPEIYDFRSAEETAGKRLTIAIKPGQTLGPILQKNGLSGSRAYAITEKFKTEYDPKYLRAGENISLYFSDEANEATGEDGFRALQYRTRDDRSVFVEQAGEDLTARSYNAEYQKDVVRVASKIENSLYLDAQALGAPDKVIVQFSQIYAHSVDFQRDIRAGDEFELMFELYRDHQGKPVRAGDLLFTSFSPRQKTASYYLYEKSNGREGFYDRKGKGAKRMLMRTPVSGARLSSRFGPRKHPVLGYRKQHKGVDFAAPRGTPIMAAGTGTIVRANRFGSYGNYVRIRHSDGYATAYAHLSKFARGIKNGRRVRQGQTIGYIGATGRVTGPHLHYEVLKNGRQINPMRLAALSGKPLVKSEMPDFQRRVRVIESLRENASAVYTPLAELAAHVETSAAAPGAKLPQ